MGACSQRDVFSLFIIRRQPSMKRPEGVRMGMACRKGACSQREVFSLFIIRRQPSMKQPEGL